MTAGHAFDAPINDSGGLLHCLMPVRQNPKNHQRDKDQVYDVSDGNGPVRSVRRGARITELPLLGPIADPRTRQPDTLLMAARAHVNRRSAAADRERSAAFTQVDPDARKDAKAFSESSAQACQDSGHRWNFLKRQTFRFGAGTPFPVRLVSWPSRRRMRAMTLN